MNATPRKVALVTGASRGVGASVAFERLSFPPESKCTEMEAPQGGRRVNRQNSVFATYGSLSVNLTERSFLCYSMRQIKVTRLRNGTFDAEGKCSRHFSVLRPCEIRDFWAQNGSNRTYLFVTVTFTRKRKAGTTGEEGMSQELEIVLTPRGRNKLEQRLDYLRNVQRREVAERIRDSKQYGDLTENAEYEGAKNEQALVEGQISELRRVLQIAQVLEESDISTDHVGIGSIVQMTNLDNDDEWELTLVSSVEADPDNDLISDETPIGQALVGKKVNDIVQIQVPNGTLRYRIESIRK